MPLLEVGRVVKPHGLRGEVVVALVTDRTERLAPGSVLTVRRPSSATAVRVGQRDLETLTVASARPHMGRFLVQFLSIEGRDDAEALRDTVLCALPIADSDALFVHTLIGKSVVEINGTARGVVTSIEANPASDLLVIDERFYVPVRFVVSNGDDIVIDPPEGLFA